MYYNPDALYSNTLEHSFLLIDKVSCLVVLQIGGFKLPFVVVGSAIFLVGLASMFVLPPQNGTQSKLNFFTFLVYCLQK